MDITKSLIENLKEEGLEIAEESAKAAYNAVMKTITEFVIETENPYDDLVIPALKFVDSKVAPLLENINKADNEEA